MGKMGRRPLCFEWEYKKLMQRPTRFQNAYNAGFRQPHEWVSDPSDAGGDAEDAEAFAPDIPIGNTGLVCVIIAASTCWKKLGGTNG